MTTIKQLNTLDEDKLRDLLHDCCGSSKWVDELIVTRPYRDLNDLIEKSNQVWYNLDEMDWLEAFSQHPQIGDKKALEEKYGKNRRWSGDEQKSVKTANKRTIEELAKKNKQYLEKFGYIFIIFATGKTAKEMLEYLNTRLNNSLEKEIKIATREQNKITRLRLRKLVNLD